MMPDFGVTVGSDADLLHMRLIGVDPRSVTEYPKHCEIFAVIYDDEYPLGRAVTLATPQMIAEIFKIISSGSGLLYEMSAAIGPSITGIGGETYRPLLGLFGHTKVPFRKPSWDTVSSVWDCVNRTTIEDIRARFDLQPGEPPSDLQNWGLAMDTADPATPHAPLPPRVLAPCSPAATTGAAYPSRQARRLAERQHQKDRLRR